MKKFKKWLEGLSPSQKERLFAAICFLIFGGFGLFLLSELIGKLKPIIPVLFIILFFFWDSISDFIHRQKDLARERVKQQAARRDAIYKEIASSVVLPALHMLGNTKLDVDSLYYLALLRMEMDFIINSLLLAKARVLRLIFSGKLSADLPII